MLNGKKEDIMSLHIAVVGIDRRVTDSVITQIVDRSNEVIKSRTRELLITSDDIIYRNITDVNLSVISGKCFDQLLIVDDNRWSVINRQYQTIKAATSKLAYSCVPEEFQIQKLEI